jgi:hypothetical protein
MTQETKKNSQQGGVSVPTGTSSQPKNVLTQDELKAWWPFTRLDPSRMPKPEREECLL